MEDEEGPKDEERRAMWRTRCEGSLQGKRMAEEGDL
jgi:hypothetical protein